MKTFLEPPLTDLVRIPAGRTWSGSNDFYREEAPAHQVDIDEFYIEQHPVTNRQFAFFVNKTGWETTAEQPLPKEFESLPPELRAPGSLVFTPTKEPVDLTQWRLWWRWVPGA